MRRAALALLLALAAPSAAEAQGAPEEPAAPATPVAQPPPPTGPLAMRTGYTPDPVRVQGRTVGSRPLRELAPSCPGHVGDAPSHVLNLESNFPFLRVFAIAPRDVTLAVRAPDGRWRCGGRRVGEAPREQGVFGAGEWQVWVGSTEPGVDIPYELVVTEFRSVTPATGQGDTSSPVGGGREIGLEVEAEEGRYRDRRLRRGFLPDPREDGGRGGGEIDVRSLGGRCEGYVGAVPSHVLTLRSPFDYFRVQLGDASGEATLIVRTPGGRYLCAAPSEVNPHVDQDAWPEGRYVIWVGSREPEATPEYRICYTEVRPAEGSVACGSDRMGRDTGTRQRRDPERAPPPDEPVGDE
ncbi:MAG: hypothetical protein RLO52_37890 [Sandaracinaceae bacterium]